MREFDALCLAPVKNLSAAQIKRLRTRNKASQAVFAAFLNTSASTVRKWEQLQTTDYSGQLLRYRERYRQVSLTFRVKWS